MAKVKNISKGPRGFYDDGLNHIILQPGEEKEFNMTENDYNKLKEIIEMEGEEPTIELSGSFGGVKKKTPKEEKEEAAKKAEADAKKAADEAKQAEREAKKEK